MRPKAHGKAWNCRPLAELDPALALQDAAALLDGVRWWISAGTALGLHRDGGFIPWDTDVDIGIDGTDVDPYPDDLLPWPLIRTVHHDGRPMQLCYIHPSDVPVDLYFFYRQGDVLVNVNDQCTIRKPSRFVDRLEPVGGWPAPSPIEDYLAWRYKNWRTPTGRKRPWIEDAGFL